jgi:hypothetical protein
LIQTQDGCECQTGDGNEFDDCSDGSGATDGRMRVFLVLNLVDGSRYGQHGGRRGVFVIMKMKNNCDEKPSIKEKGEGEKEMRFESFIHKCCENSNLPMLIKSIYISLK